MIEKMKFLSITGPKADIDRVVNTYLSKYEIHLENALSELTTVQNLTPFLEINPYKEALNTANLFCEELNSFAADTVKAETAQAAAQTMDVETALDTIRRIQTDYQDLDQKRADLENQLTTVDESLRVIRPFRNLDFDISSILKFRFIRFRFGRIGKEYYQKFERYIYDNLDTIFIKCDEDDQYIWGMYFVPEPESQKVKAVYSSMHFEKIYMPDSYEGTAREAFEQLAQKRSLILSDFNTASQKRNDFLISHCQEILAARAAIARLSGNFDIRKLAACTRGKGESDIFYILCGWMTEKDAHSFQTDIKDDSKIFCIIDGEDDEHIQPETHQQPPTKLKNPKLFKPFEMYINMYGLPAYNEMDPTWFVAITYSFIFGAMFGDAGQGLLLFIGGFLLYKFKHIALAGIISCAGVFSTIFGILFGSFFGFENLFPALWLRPMNNMMTVPFIGKLNTVFIVAIGFGMGLILLCMIFNILNAWKAHDTEHIWFDTNSVAGLVFYGSATVSIALILTGHTLPGGIVLFIMFGIPLILIFFKEPLTALVEKKSEIMPKEKGMFIVQGLFEMFEVLLSYFSNTLSFVRIGAFAVSHAAMMEVVLMLAGFESGHLNWVVVILGNLFVSGMEGLIVGIQVLRLEYYEMFSRFYKGTGRKFEPFRPTK
ncbi:V-type ATP synthase subunit I [Blautia difficilis]|uniref:ATPase n=1 Tax=Blautia difficilis TaxID=2763027 RepID=A0ABR7IFU2_9FIRM|nr:V-type ATPase 116kDa subunit family protein [Blautia difficilis]MBC5778835.1 ATPase [Blautia difficilis]